MSDTPNPSFPMTPSGAGKAASRPPSADQTETRNARRYGEKQPAFPTTPLKKNGRQGHSDSIDGGGSDPIPSSSMPKIHRVSMTPVKIERHPTRRLWRKLAGNRGAIGIQRGTQPAQLRVAGRSFDERDWRRAAKRRRAILAIVVVAQTALATWSLAQTFPYPQLSGLEIAILSSFALLFSWISFSFWAGVAGFLVLWKKGRGVSVGASAPPNDQPLRGRTAVLIPICNEEVGRVIAGLEATYRSLADTGRLEHFDFFLLSDTNDPDKQVEEELHWAELCQAIQGFGRIFYRHRRNNIKRKSGNIADFLRRWGSNYDYMIVFDADSIMAGETIVRLAQMMDRYPQVGIIQTAPTIVNRESFFARVQQFSSRAYGLMFSASLQFWQQGESYYWGHNAILRVESFVKGCGLSRLPGHPPLGGEILSHDFVEAALMGRAGLEVWLAYDLPGTFEESPPTLLDELKRDRRWCQGNLQHLRLLFSDGIRFGHRAIMGMGIMAYASAAFWTVFLVLSTAELIAEALIPPVYFSSSRTLFPLWPQWHPELAIALLSTTALLLFFPKFLSFLLILKNREAARFGGPFRLYLSIMIEIIVSTLLAPIRMWFHSKFVLLTLLGRQIKWAAQCRDGGETGWLEALRQHGVATAVSLAWMGGLFWLNSALAWWLVPVALSLILSVPLSVYSSRISLGRWLRQWGLLVVPEETVPIAVLDYLRAALMRSQKNRRQAGGFTRIVTESYAYELHSAIIRGKKPKSAKTKARNGTLRQRAVAQGPEHLSPSDRRALLRDVESMTVLHRTLRRAGNGPEVVLQPMDRANYS